MFRQLRYSQRALNLIINICPTLANPMAFEGAALQTLSSIIHLLGNDLPKFVYMTKNEVDQSVNYVTNGVCISISGGVSMGRVCYQRGYPVQFLWSVKMFGQLVATSGKAIFVYHIMEVFKGFNMIVVIYQKSALLKQQYYSLNPLLSITYFQSSVIFKL